MVITIICLGVFILFLLCKLFANEFEIDFLKIDLNYYKKKYYKSNASTLEIKKENYLIIKDLLNEANEKKQLINALANRNARIKQLRIDQDLILAINRNNSKVFNKVVFELKKEKEKFNFLDNSQTELAKEVAGIELGNLSKSNKWDAFLKLLQNSK